VRPGGEVEEYSSTPELIIEGGREVVEDGKPQALQALVLRALEFGTADLALVAEGGTVREMTRKET